MSNYVINPGNGVVHATSCSHGPGRKGSSPSAYEELPWAVIDYLPSVLFCTWCCEAILNLRAKGKLPTPEVPS